MPTYDTFLDNGLYSRDLTWTVLVFFALSIRLNYKKCCILVLFSVRSHLNISYSEPVPTNQWKLSKKSAYNNGKCFGVQDVIWQDNSSLTMKGTHYTDIDGSGRCRHVILQDHHYTGQDTAKDRTASDRSLSWEIKESTMTVQGKGWELERTEECAKEGWHRRATPLSESLSLKVMVMS